MKMTSKRFKARLPRGLRIGERFLLSFDDPALKVAPYPGRLQDLSADGALCIDAPADLRPPRGTPVTISSLPRSSGDYCFSSEILGRRRLRDRLPVLLIKPPAHIEGIQRRASYRLPVCLRTLVEWEEEEDPLRRHRKRGVLVNLSGGGARIFLRHLPAAQTLRLSVSVPGDFVEEWTRHPLCARRMPEHPPLARSEVPPQLCEKIPRKFKGIEARIVHSRVHSKDARGTLYALATAFAQPHEGCYRLVRFLERQAIQKGVHPPTRPLATAA